MISPSNHFVFTPLLPSTAVGTLEFRAIQEPVRSLGGINYLQGKARSIDFDRKVIHCQGTHTMAGVRDFEVSYDKLVCSVGVKTHTFDTPNVADFEGRSVWFLKHLHHARGIRLRTLELFEVRKKSEPRKKRGRERRESRDRRTSRERRKKSEERAAKEKRAATSLVVFHSPCRVSFALSRFIR